MQLEGGTLMKIKLHNSIVREQRQFQYRIGLELRYLNIRFNIFSESMYAYPEIKNSIQIRFFWSYETKTLNQM